MSSNYLVGGLPLAHVSSGFLNVKIPPNGIIFRASPIVSKPSEPVTMDDLYYLWLLINSVQIKVISCSLPSIFMH
ncbi:hypothetical protein TNCV_2069871 [Trichonephila clavipes]|uniref:Uncharacterized protein n=1 Tax=Trichonephila clavipes TaxID=2585209 RepID=A0A8X6W307_TRICX|nr:hypothetical protein TNCV_2069871 [Trichonephila clavipes]